MTVVLNKLPQIIAKRIWALATIAALHRPGPWAIWAWDRGPGPGPTPGPGTLGRQGPGARDKAWDLRGARAQPGR